MRAPETALWRPPLRPVQRVCGPHRPPVTGTKTFSRAIGRTCKISSSVDFIDGAGNKTPRTVRSQIVPRPVLTSLPTRTCALLGNVKALLLFSIRLLQLHCRLYLSYICLSKKNRARRSVLILNFASTCFATPIRSLANIGGCLGGQSPHAAPRRGCVSTAKTARRCSPFKRPLSAVL